MKSYELGAGVRHTVNDYTKFSPNDNVKIYVRAKPMSVDLEPPEKSSELESNTSSPVMQSILKAGENPDRVLILRNPDPMRITEDIFAFDHVYRANTNQENLFTDMAVPLIDKVLSGYNGCIFAYGQTGAGKTYTMFGEQSMELAGVIPRTADYVFRQLQEMDYDVAVGCSIIEIYNERVRDVGSLFAEVAADKEGCEQQASTSEHLSLDHAFVKAKEGMNIAPEEAEKVQNRYRSMDLDVVQGNDGEVIIKDLTILKVHNTTEIMKMIDYGLLLRETHGTNMNATSSRSHTVFTMRIIQRDKKSGVAVSGVLHMVDLAGSERLDDSKSTGQRLKEEIFINSSLTVLGKVIMSLDPTVQKKHVPYRESKLTRILQNSLSGNSYVSVLANINPNPNWYFECLSTMEFVSRCRNVHNDPRINYYESSQDAMNDWVGFGKFAPPVEEAPELKEPEHRLIAKGSKVYWRANAAVDFYLYEHIDSDVVELIAYNTGIFLEFDHIFLLKSVLFSRIARIAERAIAQKHHKAFTTGAHHPPSVAGDHTQVFESSHAHSKHQQLHDAQEAAGELVELMDRLVGEYAMEHVVYINGNAHHPPSIRFISDLPELEDGSDAPFVAEKPTNVRNIVRPMNQRDRALLDSLQNGKTREEIERLQNKANDYLTQAATLLNLDLNAAAAQARAAAEANSAEKTQHKLKGMMDSGEDEAAEAEDPHWAKPKRNIISPVSSSQKSKKDPPHIPHVIDHYHPDVHHDHALDKLGSQLHEEHLPDIPHAPDHYHVHQDHALDKLGTHLHEEHLPHVSFRGTPSLRHLTTSESGTLQDGHTLHKVFRSYTSEKYDQLGVFEFKKMCRELNLTNNKFNTGSAEGVFRKILATVAHTDNAASAAEGRITFKSFPALLRIVAHERQCLYDSVVNIIVNSHELKSESES